MSSKLITVFYNNELGDDEINILQFIKENIKAFNNKNFRFMFVEKENIKDLIFRYGNSNIETNKVITFLKSILSGNISKTMSRNGLGKRPGMGIGPLGPNLRQSSAQRQSVSTQNNESVPVPQKTQAQIVNTNLLNSTSAHSEPSIDESNKKTDNTIPIQNSKTVEDYIQNMNHSKHFSEENDVNFKTYMFALDENNSQTNI